MESPGAAGRRRGTSRSNVEDQALDQIAKEVSTVIPFNRNPSKPKHTHTDRLRHLRSKRKSNEHPSFLWTCGASYQTHGIHSTK